MYILFNLLKHFKETMHRNKQIYVTRGPISG